MRLWSNTEDDGSIHPIGNGQMLVYEQGPNINQIVGPPYSSPSFAGLSVEEYGQDIYAESTRETGTAIWRHDLYDGTTCVARMIDFMLPDSPAFIRDIDADREFVFRLSCASDIRMEVFGQYISTDGTGPSASVALTIPKGSTFFTHDSIIEERNLLLTCTGSILLERDGEGRLIIRVKAGCSRLIFCSGNFQQAVLLTEEILGYACVEHIKETKAFWHEFTSRRKDFSVQIPSDHPLRSRMLDAIDSVSVLIKCQQSEDGGVAAGHYYPMAYVRDQAGVFRGLLALGYLDEARAILAFWLHKWKLFGNLFNAEGMGNDHARLFFTNDEVEIPAYVILCCMMFHEAMGDDHLLEEQLPMLKWALDGCAVDPSGSRDD